MSQGTATTPLYWIEDVEQISACESCVRVEIIDAMGALGPCSIAEVARQLGRSSNSLYHHFRLLVDAGLLTVAGERRVRGQLETLYDTPARSMALKYDPDDPENIEAVSRVVDSISRVAARDFKRGFRQDLAVVSGPRRNLWAARGTGWLSDEELEQVNQHLIAIAELLAHTRSSEGRKLHAVSWVLAPNEDCAQ